MKKRERHYKEVIRSKVLSLRLTDEEFLRLKANALRDRMSVSKMVRNGVTELIKGTPAVAAVAATSQAG